MGLTARGRELANELASARADAHAQWGWKIGAGPPGSRVPALQPGEEHTDEPVVLPAADEPVRFESTSRTCSAPAITRR
jgi:hypothetical protein